MKHNRFRTISLSIIWLWLVIFALVPYAMILATSFLSSDADHLITWPLTLKNYIHLFDFLYLKIFLRSFLLAGLTTILCLIIAYPFAYILAHVPARYKNLLLLLLIIPFWTSSVIRTFAMTAILETKGYLNSFLLALGIIHKPLQLLYTNLAVLIGLIYNLLPFMILPIYSNVENLDQDIIIAAKDLGAKSHIIFRKIVIPLTMPGILAGCLMVFLPAMTLFYIPDILGGSKSMLLGNLIEQQFLFSINFPMGGATSILLTVIMGILLFIYWFKIKNNQGNLLS